jgi:hypothetical protein
MSLWSSGDDSETGDAVNGGAFAPQMHARPLRRCSVQRWLENPCFQPLCGEEFFQYEPTFDRTSLTRSRQRISEDKLVALIQESLNLADQFEWETMAAIRRGQASA